MGQLQALASARYQEQRLIDSTSLKNLDPDCMCTISSSTRTVAMFVLSVCLGSAIASEQATKPKKLELIWELPIADSRERPSQQLPARILQTGNGELIAADSRIVPLNRRGPGEATLLDTKALILDVALDSQGNIWAGGRINQHAWAPGADTADAYLGRFSRNGQKLAEFVFGEKSWLQFGRVTWQQITGLHPRRDGGVLVTGAKGNGTWLASISDQGKITWEKTIGVTAASAVTEGQDGNIAFVGLRNAQMPNQAYEEEAVFWLLTPQGRVLTEQIIRPSVNSQPGRRFAEIAIEASPDGYFALVSWADSFDDKPLTVTKVSLTGAVKWNVSLKHTATPQTWRPSAWDKCNSRKDLLRNGDLLVTCSVGGELVISRLDGKSGVESAQRIALPPCHEKRPAVITAFPTKENSILLFGSRPSGNVGASCSWLAEWALNP